MNFRVSEWVYISRIITRQWKKGFKLRTLRFSACRGACCGCVYVQIVWMWRRFFHSGFLGFFGHRMTDGWMEPVEGVVETKRAREWNRVRVFVCSCVWFNNAMVL